MKLSKLLETLALDERLQIHDVELRKQLSRSDYYYVRGILIDLGILKPISGNNKKRPKIWMIDWVKAQQVFPELEIPPNLLVKRYSQAKPVSGEAHA